MTPLHTKTGSSSTDRESLEAKKQPGKIMSAGMIEQHDVGTVSNNLSANDKIII